MADYYFNCLSPHDFEILVRDLLQAHLDIRLESFSPGPDGGIDLRHAKGPESLVVQCKHYPHTNWNSLRRVLAEEVGKLKQLRPSRYILATSMGLSPDRKREVLRMFLPFCLEPGDVLGREDLNNLLSLHPKIEGDHHKLWLTSVPILSRILNAGVFSEQRAELEQIQRRVSRFVRNPSLPRALKALEAHHVVVITGVPGIGKSTLAEMLLIEHLSRDFEPFRVWEGVEEARAVLRRADRQLFYFDDFLGRTGLRHSLFRNEDERLIRFIREVSESPNTRMILTTREYILHQAQKFMEALNTGEIEFATCVINLGDYTPRIRAEILYNHLYFSDLPEEHLSALLFKKTYLEIIRHRNYNPRILESMTDALNVRALAPIDYPQRFLEALENPKRIWEVAFQEHLSVEAQHVLLILTTLPDRTPLPEAERAFEVFHRDRGERYGIARTPYDWQRALKELEGNFIKTELRHRRIILEFHNPSIRDFLESHLIENKADVSELVESAVFSQQISRLWKVMSKEGLGKSTVALINMLADRYWELRNSDAIGPTLRQHGSGSLRWIIVSETPLGRLMVLWDMVLTSEGANRDVLSQACQDALEVVKAGPVDRLELVSLMERFLDSRQPAFSPDHALFNAAQEKSFEFEDFEEVAEFAALAWFADKFPEALSEDDKDDLAEAFGDFVSSEEQAILEESDPDARLAMFDELEAVSSSLDVGLGITRQELEENAGYVGDEDDSGWSPGQQGEDGVISDAALHSLFDSLRGPRGGDP